MQILGLSDSTPKPENRLKSLFWPRIRYVEDVDLLGTQGYWVCVVLAVYTLVIGLLRHVGPAVLVDAFYYYLAGVGIRSRSRFAAASVFVIYLLSVIAAIKITHTGGIGSVFFLALLLSNVRATWLANRFETEQVPQGQHETGMTSPTYIFTDVLPRLIWPVGKWLYYGLTVLMLLGICVLLFRMTVRGGR